MQVCAAGLKVTIVEFISDVPTEGPKLSSLLNDGMEEA